MPALSANVMQGWIENPQSLKRVLAEALLPPPQEFEVWKTVKIGTFQNVDAIRETLRKENVLVQKYANSMLQEIPLTTSEIEINLVSRSVAELGFKDGAEYEDICQRAKEIGLELCPAEVGPQLSRGYNGQVELIIAMEPIYGNGPVRELFTVLAGCQGPWLYSRSGNPKAVWHAEERFVFMYSRK
ncbi:MAG: hypothetical protein WC470_03110 [Candidatus Paceibacterota bacterium]